jgi:glutaredoxin
MKALIITLVALLTLAITGYALLNYGIPAESSADQAQTPDSITGQLRRDEDGKIIAELYYLTTCPYCHQAIDLIDKTLKTEYPDIAFRLTNVRDLSGARKKEFNEFTKRNKANSVPIFRVGDEFLIGFDQEATPAAYRALLDNALKGVPNEVSDTLP